jgi:hypothetical protein
MLYVPANIALRMDFNSGLMLASSVEAYLMTYLSLGIHQDPIRGPDDNIPHSVATLAPPCLLAS